jgi:hypothetical protein
MKSMRGIVRRAALTLVLSVGVSAATPGPAQHADAAGRIPLYVFAGQSNMVGAYAAAVELPTIDPTLHVQTKNVLFWGPTADFPSRWGPLTAPTEIRQTYTHSGFGPEVSSAPGLAARHPEGIAIVKYAWNGTNLHTQWNPKNSLGLYGGLVSRVRYAMNQLKTQQGKSAYVAGFFWMQGESDTMRKTHATAYGKNLEKFITSLRKDLRAPRMPFVISKIRDIRKIRPLYRYSSVVRQEQARVARRVSHTYIVSTDGLELTSLSPIHFSTRGTVGLGRRLVSRSIPL